MMNVTCILCDRRVTLEKDSFRAKRMRNKQDFTFLCDACDGRITKKTKERLASGNFRLYRDKQTDDLI